MWPSPGEDLVGQKSFANTTLFRGSAGDPHTSSRMWGWDGCLFGLGHSLCHSQLYFYYMPSTQRHHHLPPLPSFSLPVLLTRHHDIQLELGKAVLTRSTAQRPRPGLQGCGEKRTEQAKMKEMQGDIC